MKAFEIVGGKPKRRLTLLDAMVLVGTTAIGFAWVCSNWYFDTFSWPDSWIDEAPDMLGPLLMTWTLAVVLLRLLPPRPPLHRLVLQPGAAACGSVAFAFMVGSARYFALLFTWNKHIPWGAFGHSEAWVDLMSSTIVSGNYHNVVMSVWGLLFLSRRCRPEPSWIDRVGRAIGLSWVLLALCQLITYMVSRWGDR